MKHVYRMIFMSLFLGLYTALVMSASAYAELGYFRQPAVSGDTLVFVAEGDLWRANIAGGVAQRLTTHPSEESNPAISPDGKWVAFTGRYEGPAEVYVMPISGGQPTRLTFEGDTARVQGWTPDGKVIYATARYSGKPMMRLYTVDVNTRISLPIPLAEAGEGCYLRNYSSGNNRQDGSSLYFTRQPLNSDNVKRYQGGLVQQIWKFEAGANHKTENKTENHSEAILLTGDYKGTSRQPMCGNGRLYFLSDREGSFNLWSMDANGGDLIQHTKYQEFDIRGASIAADGRTIAYQRGADIYVFDTASRAEKKLNITLQSDFEHTRTRWVKTPWDFVSQIEASPNGDRVAITARGQVFIAPVGAGRRIEITRESELRARDAMFAPDGKSIYAFADTSGEVELWRYPANGVGPGKQLTKNATILRQRASPSPDGKWVAHADKDRQLFLLNLASGEDRQIDRSSNDEYETIVWSPDSRWIAFSKSGDNFFEAMYLIEIATGQRTQITSDRYDARDAAFSPDGKWLYFLSKRNLQSLVTSPWGQRNPEPFFDRQTKIYALALDPQARWPFLPKDELQPPEKKQDTKPDEKLKKSADNQPISSTGAASGEVASQNIQTDVAVKISPLVLNGVAGRLYEVPVAAGNYSLLSTDGKRLYLVVTESTVEGKQSLRSVAIESPTVLPATLDLFFDEIRTYRLTQDRKKIFIRRANDLFIFETGKAAPPPPEQAKFAVNLRDWTFPVDPREEWKQMFVDAWRLHRDYFYDKDMHGVDWRKARARYEPLMARVTDRAEVNDVIAQMTAEVAALHSQVNTNDLRRGQDTIDVSSLGADAEKTPQGFRITKIFGGDPELLEERSPLARPEVNVKIGETITAVNGIAANLAVNLGELLRNQTQKQVLLTVSDHNGKLRDVIVHPVDTRRDRELRYLAWERERNIKVENSSNQRIGYVHLQAMGPNDIARWAREFYPVFAREGLIIDLRHNRGGSIDSWIIEKLQRRAWHFWQSRTADTFQANQQLAFRGHIVALIDADTYSDGETMAQGLKRLAIAPLIGVTTAGAGIWLSDFNRLRDNGIARAAESGVFVDNEKENAWITEGVGVAPDIRVDNLPHATFNGGDAQLDAAIAYLMDKMTKEPMRKPTRPSYPSKSL